MPIDLSGFVESIQQGFGQIPPVAIAIALLGGPTATLIVYRLIGVARRTQVPNETAAALWVCRDCRSVNQLRLSRCYRCGLDVDATEEIDVVLDLPSVPRTPFEVPVGSPFAASGGATRASEVGDQRAPGVPGVPVMADRSSTSEPVPVGPGHLADLGAGVGAGVGVGGGVGGAGVGVRPPVAEDELARAAERDA